MLPAAKEEMLSPPNEWSDEHMFSFAADVGLPALGTHRGAGAAQGKKPYQGIFPTNRELRIGEIWAKWSGTYQDSETWGRKTASGSALDANGSTLTDGLGRNFTWDFENRLVQAVVTGTNGGTTTFKYDGFGRRIQKSGPLGSVIYFYDGYDVVVETDSSGSVVASYSRTLNVDEPLAMLRQSPSYYQIDGHGSVTSLTSTSGNIVQTYDYDSFGKQYLSSGAISNPYQYTAREFDSDTNMYYYRARYYDNQNGRFISEDPLTMSTGMNYYRYVDNNPQVFNDPFGLWKNTGKPPQPTENTIVCNGHGGINVHLADYYDTLPLFMECLKDCAIYHERLHIRQALVSNPKICQGVAAGIQLDYSSNQEYDVSEIAAYTAEIQCLQKKKKKDKCERCKDLIDSAIDDKQRRIRILNSLLSLGH